jgi:hypothetical protein
MVSCSGLWALAVLAAATSGVTMAQEVDTRAAPLVPEPDQPRSLASQPRIVVVEYRRAVREHDYFPLAMGK